MITIFHGEDQVSSRNAIPKEAIMVDSKNVTEEYLIQLSTGGSLFADNKTIVIENPKNFPQNITGDFILWFDHKLSASQEKSFPGAIYKEFKINEIVFKFVQSLRPKNKKEVLSLFANYCSQEQIEIVFTMIVRQFRLMLNPGELSSWQKDRVLAQAKFFTKADLKNKYNALLEIDFATKNGLAPIDLKGSIELFLLGL